MTEDRVVGAVLLSERPPHRVLGKVLNLGSGTITTPGGSMAYRVRLHQSGRLECVARNSAIVSPSGGRMADVRIFYLDPEDVLRAVVERMRVEDELQEAARTLHAARVTIEACCDEEQLLGRDAVEVEPGVYRMACRRCGFTVQLQQNPSEAPVDAAPSVAAEDVPTDLGASGATR